MSARLRARRVSVDAVLLFFLAGLARGATATAVGALVGWVVAFSSVSGTSAAEDSSESSGVATMAIVAEPGLAPDLLKGGFGFEDAAGARTVTESSSSSIMTLRAGAFDVDWRAVVAPGVAAPDAAPALLSASLAGGRGSFLLRATPLDAPMAGVTFETALARASLRRQRWSDHPHRPLPEVDLWLATCDWRP